MSEISGIALGGMQKAAASVAENAEKISSGEDLGSAESIVALKQAENAFQANAKVLEVEKKMTDSLLDILA